LSIQRFKFKSIYHPNSCKQKPTLALFIATKTSAATALSFPLRKRINGSIPSTRSLALLSFNGAIIYFMLKRWQSRAVQPAPPTLASEENQREERVYKAVGFYDLILYLWVHYLQSGTTGAHVFGGVAHFLEPDIAVFVQSVTTTTCCTTTLPLSFAL
jgi:hypothetical protein